MSVSRDHIHSLSESEICKERKCELNAQVLLNYQNVPVN